MGIRMNEHFKRAFAKLDYYPETGLFIWRESPSFKCKPGSSAGSQGTNGYWQITVAGRTYPAHRLAWLKYYGEWPEHQVDHINSIRIDNRVVNLRLATSSQNMHNPLRKKSDGKSSRHMGVSYSSEKNKWIAQIGINGKTKKLGSFINEIDAANAYKAAKKNILTSIFETLEFP